MDSEYFTQKIKSFGNTVGNILSLQSIAAPNHGEFISKYSIGRSPTDFIGLNSAWHFAYLGKPWDARFQRIDNPPSLPPSSIGYTSYAIVADAALDFMRMCSMYPGQHLACPSAVAHRFIKEWSFLSRDSYQDAVRRLGINKLTPDRMSLADFDCVDPVVVENNQRTWVAACLLYKEDIFDREYIPNVYVMDQMFGMRKAKIFSFDSKEDGLTYESTEFEGSVKRPIGLSIDELSFALSELSPSVLTFQAEHRGLIMRCENFKQWRSKAYDYCFDGDGRERNERYRVEFLHGKAPGFVQQNGNCMSLSLMAQAERLQVERRPSN